MTDPPGIDAAPGPRFLRSALAAAVVAVAGGSAAAQQDNPVYVDDSPRAWELFRLAQDQARDNEGESVRLFQELLDDYGLKLLPVSETARDHFVAVRRRVLAEILGNQRLLERGRLGETAEGRRLLASGELERLIRTRSLTEPGLEALLRLAQEDLESAHFHAALDRLWQAAEHPDLGGRRAAHCWYMIGVAAAYLSRPQTVNDAGAALRSLDETLAVQLDAVAGAPVPAVLSGISSLDLAASAEIEQLVAQPIWSLPLEDTPLSHRLSDPLGGEPANRRVVDQMRRSGALLTAAPTVAGERVYLNEGRTVHALDRFTGRAVWSPYVERRSPSAVEKGSRQIADLNVVALEGNSLVTITGHAYADAAKSERSVVCLDADTGRLRWARRVDRLSGSDELDGLFPHGAPIIAEGTVYVLARKVSRQLLTSCYVIAMDLADGRLRWFRHVASSGGIRSRFARPFSSPIHADGDLGVATAIGAVARIDATTGQTVWLRRYNPPLSPYLADRQPWEISSPIVTRRGIVAIRPDHRHVVLLDWSSGDEIESVGATGRETWNTPKYLLGDGDMVYGVGGEIRAFRLEALEEPVWSFPSRDDAAVRRDLEDFEPLEIRGRVQLTAGGLIVPTVDGVLLLDADTGRVVHRVDLDSVGNPVTAGAQLIVAGSDSLESYMPMDRAQQMLREQIAAVPDDPDPALALMRLGVRVRDLDLSLEAAELAIGAINARPPGESTNGQRQELFDVLLALDEAAIAATVEEGEALHAMIGLVAQAPRQQVEHLLAYGAWLSSHALGPAVEAYQAILSTPGLPETPRRHEGVTRPASAWAAERLAALIEEHGPRAYRPQSDFAAGRLQQLQRGERDPESLVALSREFPFSGAAIEAATAAAEIWAAEGQRGRAAAALAALFRLTPDRDRAARLIGELAVLGEDAGWDLYARSVLRYAVDAFGDVQVVGEEGRRSAAAWLARLEAGDRRRARVGDTRGVAERLAGVVVLPHPAARGSLPRDRVLVHDAPELAMIPADTLTPSWATVLAIGGAPWVLRSDEEALILWLEAPGEQARAVRLDPADGSQVWVTPELPELGADPLRRPAGAELLPRGQQFDPDEVLPLLGADTLVLAGRSGGALALDLADGDTVRWSRTSPRPLDQVHLAALHDLALVLAGARRGADGRELEPLIVVIDPATGRTVREIEPLESAPVRWMVLGPLGELVYGNGAGLEAVDLVAGERWWSITAPDARGAPRAWAVDGSVVVEVPVAGPAEGMTPLRAVDVIDGSRSRPFDAPDRGEWDRLDLRELLVDRGRIFGRYGQRVVRFSARGTVLGADVVSDTRDYKWLLPTEDRLLLVSRFKSEPFRVPGESRMQQQYTYRVYPLSENCRLMAEGVELPPMSERLERAAVIDDWLLLSTASGTLAVAMGQESH